MSKLEKQNYPFSQLHKRVLNNNILKQKHTIEFSKIFTILRLDSNKQTMESVQKDISKALKCVVK